MNTIIFISYLLLNLLGMLYLKYYPIGFRNSLTAAAVVSTAAVNCNIFFTFLMKRSFINILVIILLSLFSQLRASYFLISGGTVLLGCSSFINKKKICNYDVITTGVMAAKFKLNKVVNCLLERLYTPIMIALLLFGFVTIAITIDILDFRIVIDDYLLQVPEDNVIFMNMSFLLISYGLLFQPISRNIRNPIENIKKGVIKCYNT